MTHRDICIRFIVRNGAEERRYKAVGFLNDGEPSVTSDEMFARIAEKHGEAIGEEDALYIDARLNLDKTDGHLYPFCLVTSQHGPGGDPRIILGFSFRGFAWFRSWILGQDQFDGNHLVICRNNDPPA
ncbi:MAG TPA: hypothetical protein DEB73_02915 [Candidatus Magasanikbacteria bacterium]|nr:hypothetical protein [Candidatus Magasanikbacteria bacterium]